MFGVSHRQLLILAVVGLFIAACAAPIPVDKRIVALMPEAVAKNTLERLLGPDWVRAPYVDKWGTCLPERVPISFRDIKQTAYNPTLGKLFIHASSVYLVVYVCNETVSFSLNERDAEEATTALRSLGALSQK